MRYTSARMVSATVFSGDMAGSLLWDSTQALTLGTSAAASHGLGVGDVLVGGDLEVDGVTYFDGQIFVGNGSLPSPSIAFTNYPTSGLFMDGDKPAIVRGGVKMVSFGGGPAAAFAGNVNMISNTIYSSIQALELGTAATTSNGLASGDVLVGGALEVDGTAYLDGGIKVPPYNVDYVMPAGGAILGATAPTFEVNGIVGGLGFDADAEAAYLNFEIPSSWDGTSDLKLKVYWVAESGDAPLLNETVKWDFEYRSLVWGTEDADNGTAVTATATYTETADPGDDQDTHTTEITLDFDDANQPLTAGDVIIGRFDRDVTGDTYSGLGIVHHWEVEVQEDKVLRDHL